MSDGSDPDTNPSSIFGYVHDHAPSEETGVTNYDFDDPDDDPEEDDKSNLLWLMGVSLRLMRTATLAIDAVNAALEAYSDTYHNKRPYHISKLLNLATAFCIFTTVTKHTEATDPQCRSGTAPQNSQFT
jgi:hypothetical protein